jgi:hypothetical protein
LRFGGRANTTKVAQKGKINSFSHYILADRPAFSHEVGWSTDQFGLVAWMWERLSPAGRPSLSATTAEYIAADARFSHSKTGEADAVNKCTNCGISNAWHNTECECGNFLGYPNVRTAEETGQVAALERRADAARVASKALSADQNLRRFSDAVQNNSEAVVGRDLGTIDSLAKSQNAFYISYHRQVRSGARRPEDNKWDAIRQQVDAAMFPHYFESIVFASLSLDGLGDTNYGLYFMTLRDVMVKMRASVFEGNSISFADKHNLRLVDPIPDGFRAPWDERHTLAVAKLFNQISPTTLPADFPGILLQPGTGGDAEFIEVHIYGALGVASIASVYGVIPTAQEDRILWRSAKRQLNAHSITVQER